MVRSLQQIAGEHAILVGAHTLVARFSFTPQDVDIGVLHNFQLVLLVDVEIAVKGCGWQFDGLSDEVGEGGGYCGHAGEVFREDGPEIGEEGGAGPFFVLLAFLGRGGEPKGGGTNGLAQSGYDATAHLVLGWDAQSTSQFARGGRWRQR